MRRAHSVALLSGWMLLAGAAFAQTQVHGHVVDRTGSPVAGIEIETGNHVRLATTDGTGAFTAELPAASGGQVMLRAVGLSLDSGDVSVSTSNLGQDIRLVVGPAVLKQEATVTATRTSVEVGPTAVTQYSLSAEDLNHYPALTLDESLRQHAGFELFRRSSSWVQNPTSQGVSLRGLGSTAASRTLVLANSAPLNDPVGGWLHWDELPPEAIDAVTITTGGGSDLYGSSALGGVIDVVPAHPQSKMAVVDLSTAGDDTRMARGRGDLQQGRWHELIAGQDFRTAGYILTAPGSRGSVDVPANVHFENGRVEINREISSTNRAFLTGNVLNERRGNGTPLTWNGTRLWRYLGGDDWNAGSHMNGRVRLFGTNESYDQSFTSINATRSVETLTRLQQVGAQELGASTDATYHLANIAFVAGADVRDIRANDFERPTKGATFDASARQRFIGGFGEIIAQHGKWSGAASIRVDSAENLDTVTFSGPTPTAIPNRSEVVASPRVGIVRQVNSHVSVHASGYRAFRTPTINELYRTFQVGQEITQANANLVSERGTGAEGGVSVHAGIIGLQATYFWTEINRPVASVTIASTSTSITQMRQNLGQIQSQGLETAVQINEGHALSATVGYQYAHAIVTKFSADPTLIGTWIPDVPRESATAQIRYRSPRIGQFILSARNSGRAYDDSENTLILHSFFQLDLYGERQIGHGFAAYLSIQNMLDRRADVARTPLLSQGIPTIAQGGIRYAWGKGD